jgi:hypothetical protein
MIMPGAGNRPQLKMVFAVRNDQLNAEFARHNLLAFGNRCQAAINLALLTKACIKEFRTKDITQ